MYYTENNHNKVVLRDFYLSRFENGSITEPCGTPEYLGTYINQQMNIGIWIWYRVLEYVLYLSLWLFFPSSPGGCGSTSVWKASGLLGHWGHHVHAVSSHYAQQTEFNVIIRLDFPWLDYSPQYYRIIAQLFLIYTRAQHYSTNSTFSGCREILPSMMRQKRRTQTCTIVLSSAGLLLETTSLTLRTGMTYHLQVRKKEAVL